MTGRRIQIYCDKDNRYRWRMIATNGRIIADSAEAYQRLANLEQTLDKHFKVGWRIDRSLLVRKTKTKEKKHGIKSIIKSLKGRRG